uniref:OTU domain-containing protein n=1 Tax=Leersia perrieri TaxID=77586 RepID=A0A0D9UVR7_9ORYZ
MGKLLCDSPAAAVAVAVAEALPSSPSPSPAPAAPLLTWPSPEPTTPTSWTSVAALEDQQRRRLHRIWERGVAWKPSSPLQPLVFRLDHAGEVDADGNCLFTAARRAAAAKPDARDLRHRVVRRFAHVYAAADAADRDAVDAAVRHLYDPDLKAGWGVHVVQELKLLAPKAHRDALDAAIQDLVDIGVQREMAAETIYKERCIAVNDGDSWAKYMSVSGSAEDEHDIITLQYTEEGLLTIDENRDGHAAAFGDDIAIECLATEFKREVYVVQAHGADAMVDEENCVFFLPHRPRGEICEPPIFLFMKGTAWCGAGADHYEPLVATVLQNVTPDKAAVVL